MNSVLLWDRIWDYFHVLFRSLLSPVDGWFGSLFIEAVLWTVL